MQLTKDEIDALWLETFKPDGFDGHRERFAAAVIAKHTAKVLEGVEPVGTVEAQYPASPSWNGEVRVNLTAKLEPGTKLYPATIVAALLASCRDAFQIPGPDDDRSAWSQAMGDPLSVPAYVKSRADALQARVDAVEKDAARYRSLKNHRGMEHDSFSVYSTLTDDILWGDDLDHEIDRIAALAAKGQA